MTRLLAFVLSLALAGVAAAETGLALLMFDAPDCGYCRQWEDEVGVVYERTAEGRVAPLRRVLHDQPTPDDLVLSEDVVYTPTFVLVRGGHELGRITGYPGEIHFWGLLDVMLVSAAPEAVKHIRP